MDTNTRHKAAILLAALLTQLAACGSVPTKVAESTGAVDCTTRHPPLAADAAVLIAPDGAVLMDGAPAGRNCAGIAAGRYDVRVVAQWSRGYEQHALEITNFRAARGQALVARAFERGRGEVRTSFVGLAPSQAAEPAPSQPQAVPERQVPATGEARQPAGQGQEQKSTAADVTPQSVAEGAALVTGAALLGVIYAPYAPVIAIEAIKADRDARRAAVAAERAKPDCCYLWVEDARTGIVVAGARLKP